jgi:hypothetical protein
MMAPLCLADSIPWTEAILGGLPSDGTFSMTSEALGRDAQPDISHMQAKNEYRNGNRIWSFMLKLYHE